MSNKVRRNGQKSAPDRGDVEALYFELLQRFYGAGDRARAEKIAPRLAQALARSPEVASSIRGEEIRSLLAELRGDLLEAARSREAEIRKILELHTLAANTLSSKYVFRQYDFSDVSDRLDLLAILYDQQGDTERAIATLIESKEYCQDHGIVFDGQDLLDELQQPRQPVARGKQLHDKRQALKAADAKRAMQRAMARRK